MPKPPFAEIWKSILTNQGKKFHTMTDFEFEYRIKGNGFFLSGTKFRISRNDFEKAYRLVPIDGPDTISKLVRGSAYVWAVLHDPRISMGKW
jgi:hypothetical protein